MTHAHWKEELLKVVNVAAYLFFLGSHFYYTVFSPQPIYENIKQTYLSPTIWGFLVWPIIHILLLGTVIYQFTSARGKTVVVHGISWEFPIVITLYGIFIVAWANHHYIAAFITSLLLVYIIALISMTLRKDLLPQSVGDELLVHLPFAACQAWSVFIGYLVAFEAFGIDAAEHQNGVFTDFFVFFALFVLMLGGAAFAFSPVVGGRPPALIISWILWSVFDNQRSSPFIHWTAFTFLIISLIWSLIMLDGIYRKCTGREYHFPTPGHERGPLHL